MKHCCIVTSPTITRPILRLAKAVRSKPPVDTSQKKCGLVNRQGHSQMSSANCQRNVESLEASYYKISMKTRLLPGGIILLRKGWQSSKETAPSILETFTRTQIIQSLCFTSTLNMLPFQFYERLNFPLTSSYFCCSSLAISARKPGTALGGPLTLLEQQIPTRKSVSRTCQLWHSTSQSASK